jgi:hypothetical protein
MRPLHFAIPVDLKNLLAAELAAVGVTGGTQTAITDNLPTDFYPTFAQLNDAENLTRTQFDAAMTPARATDAALNAASRSSYNTHVASVSATWDTLCGYQNWFDTVRQLLPLGPPEPTPPPPPPPPPPLNNFWVDNTGNSSWVDNTGNMAWVDNLGHGP